LGEGEVLEEILLGRLGRRLDDVEVLIELFTVVAGDQDVVLLHADGPMPYKIGQRLPPLERELTGTSTPEDIYMMGSGPTRIGGGLRRRAWREGAGRPSPPPGGPR